MNKSPRLLFFIIIITKAGKKSNKLGRLIVDFFVYKEVENCEKFGHKGITFSDGFLKMKNSGSYSLFFKQS